MKNYVFKSFMLLLSVSFSTYLYAAKDAPAGTIELVKGDVFILDSKSAVVADPKGARGRSTAKGSQFFEGETVQTKADGRVKLKFNEGGNEVVLGTNTSLLIERTQSNASDKSGTSLNLARGEVRSTVNKKYSGKDGDVFEVKTANAVAGVRGTVFMSRFDPKTFKSDFATEKGAVFVKGASGGAMVTAGMYTSATTGNITPAAPIASNPELQSAVQALSGDAPKSGSDQKQDGNSSNNQTDKKEQNNAQTSEKTKEEKKSAPLAREPVKEEKSTAEGSRSPASVENKQQGQPPKLMGDDSVASSSKSPKIDQIQSKVSQEMGRVMKDIRNTVDKNVTETRNFNNMIGNVTIKVE